MPDYLDQEQFATMVKVKRGKKGLRETAEEIGEISASTLSRIETGNMPDLNTFALLCNWLDVSADQLLSTGNGKNIDKLLVTGNMTTPEIIEFCLLSDDDLDKDIAKALAKAVWAVYDASMPDKE